MQADEEDADADRVQQMFDDAFKGKLWAGGRFPNVMAELQRAILDGVLDLRSIEAHRLVCLSHNLHVERPAADAVHQGIFGVSQVPGMPSKRCCNPPRSQGARTCSGRTQSSPQCRRRRIVSRLRS